MAMTEITTVLYSILAIRSQPPKEESLQIKDKSPHSQSKVSFIRRLHMHTSTKHLYGGAISYYTSRSVIAHVQVSRTQNKTACARGLQIE